MKDIAIKNFESGLNCSQSIVTAFADQFGIEKEVLCRIATPFGGGVGRTGNICGAVIGSLIIIGLKYGAKDPSDKEAKERTYTAVKKFLDEFKRCNGSILCADLLGADINTPDGVKKAHQTCQKFIGSACDLL